MCAFQTESTLYICPNVKELLARSRREIWSLSDCNWTRSHIYLVHKRTLNHLAKLASLVKWLNVRLWTKWLQFQVQFQYYWNYKQTCTIIGKVAITETKNVWHKHPFTCALWNSCSKKSQISRNMSAVEWLFSNVY